MAPDTPVWQHAILTRPERNMTISWLWVNYQCAELYPGLRKSPQCNVPATPLVFEPGLRAHTVKNLFDLLYLQMHMYLLARVNLYEVVLTTKFVCQGIRTNFNVKIGTDLHNCVTFNDVQLPPPGLKISTNSLTKQNLRKLFDKMYEYEIDPASIGKILSRHDFIYRQTDRQIMTTTTSSTTTMTISWQYHGWPYIFWCAGGGAGRGGDLTRWTKRVKGLQRLIFRLLPEVTAMEKAQRYSLRLI